MYYAHATSFRPCNFFAAFVRFLSENIKVRYCMEPNSKTKLSMNRFKDERREVKSKYNPLQTFPAISTWM